jgi:hypothetical protein
MIENGSLFVIGPMKQHMKYSLVRKPGAGKPPARFDERDVETEHGEAREAPATERAGN